MLNNAKAPKYFPNFRGAIASSQEIGLSSWQRSVLRRREARIGNGNGKTASSYLWRCLVALSTASPGPYPVCTSAAFRWGFPSLTVQGLQYLALHAGHAGSNAHAEISLKFC